MAIETFQKALQEDGGTYSIHKLGEHQHHSKKIK
jgi:Cu2+-exporting ATPase